MLDTEPPDVTETAIGPTATEAAPHLTANPFELAGTVFDVNGLRSLRITQTEAGVGTKTVFERSYDATNNKNGTWSVPSLPQAHAQPWQSASVELRTGTFTYEIIAEDVARKPAKLVRVVVVDLEPPVLTVDLPYEDAWLDGSSVTIKATQTDEHPDGPVYYLVDRDRNISRFPGGALADYAEAPGWEKLTARGTEWRDTVSIEGEGIFYLYAAAFDAAGNLTTNAEYKDAEGNWAAAPNPGLIRKFGIDLYPPQI
jgi:hypothetical protein